MTLRKTWSIFNGVKVCVSFMHLYNTSISSYCLHYTSLFTKDPPILFMMVWTHTNVFVLQVSICLMLFHLMVNTIFCSCSFPQKHWGIPHTQKVACSWHGILLFKHTTFSLSSLWSRGCDNASFFTLILIWFTGYTHCVNIALSTCCNLLPSHK